MLYALLAIAGIISWISARASYFPLKMAAGFAWFGVFAYWISANLVTDGTPTDVIVMLTLMFIGLIFLFWGISTRVPSKTVEEHYTSAGKLINRIIKSDRQEEPRKSSQFDESALEHRERVRKALNRGGRRRR